MALETELKFCKPDFARVRERLRRLGADPLGRAFERNVVLDDAGSSLRSRAMLLRLRQVAGRCVLTYKRPPAGQHGGAGLAKVLEEHETEVADFRAMLEILKGLGFKPILAYEKVREKWRLSGAVVCLDLLPFGEFVEIEADEAEILRLADELGLDPGQACAENYHELNQRHRKAAGLPPQDSFIFPEGEAERLAASMRI